MSSKATGHLQRALTLFRDAGDRTGEARALTALGDAGLRQGHYEQAADYQRQSLAVCSEIGYQSGEVSALKYSALGRVGSTCQAHAA